MPIHERDAELGTSVAARIARGSLERNIVQLGSGSYLTAGQGHFRALWTRDFCFSARGLLQLGRDDVVRDHLVALLDSRRRRDALVPRLLDSISPAFMRVLHHALAARVPGLPPPGPLRDPLVPEYRSEHGVEAIDSNLLTIQCALDYVEATGDSRFWAAREAALVEIWRFYDRHLHDGLLRQGAFADWQDSVRRVGKTSYANLLYLAVARRLLAHPRFGVRENDVRALERRVEAVFRDPDTGLFRSIAGLPHVSLDVLLLAFDRGLFADDHRTMYELLKRSALWRHDVLPGGSTVPRWPRSWLAAQVRFVGLSGYHDVLHWSWLTAGALKIARCMNDRAEAARIEAHLARLLVRDGGVHEIYVPSPPHLPWRSRWHASEQHFAWGAAYVLDAFATPYSQRLD